MTSGVGTYHGPRRSVAFDRWFRYPAGFNQAVLARCFDAANVQPGQVVVDPFTGAGTVGTASLTRQAHFRGIEAHPLIAQLATLKLTPPPTHGAVEALASVSVPLDVTLAHEHPLVTKCFSAETLAVLVGIRERLERGEGGEWSPWLTWALLATLRDVANVAVGWPYQRPGRPRIAPHRDAAVRFDRRFADMLEDLKTSESWSTSGKVAAGDSRVGLAWESALDGTLADACISSPPYLNNFDYADATRLELFFLGKASSWRELCDRFRSMMLVATTQQTSRAQQRADDARIASWPKIGDELERIGAQLTVERAERTRGKEYDAAFAGYFVGIADVLTQLHGSCRDGARIAWVIGDSAPYGVLIDTPRLIGAVAEQTGFVVVGDEKLRVRGQRWRTNGTRHQVELTERLLVLGK